MTSTLHDDALVIDGLVYQADGDVADLMAGGINAINVTVCHFEADFPQACDEIARWHRRFAQPGSPWMQIETAQDFERAKALGKIGAILGWQNTRPVADELGRLYFFRRLGMRIMQITYNFRNAFGDGCLEPEEAGLTLLGRDAVRIMNETGIAIDLSHVGQKTMHDVIALSSQPVLITHANARALANLERNKTDDIIRAVVEKGGVIGASIYGPMCWDGDPKRKPGIDDYLRHIDYIAKLAGPEHISFGTDLATGSNYPKMAFERGHWRRWEGINAFNRVFGEDIPSRYLSDCNKHSDLPKVTAALLERGWSPGDVKGYLGGNLKRVLDQIWSAGNDAK
ncbi:MAG TPA: membrane dipeptidase [Hyphomicrobiaceae bacterium]|nr:membrane dipeptidase [Hyphomicrobiaceae bacterium]